MKKLLLLLSFALISVCALAQESSNRDAQGKIVRGAYQTNRFFDNVFIQAGAGASVYLGSQNGDGFGNRIRPTFDLGLGKWLTPSVGVRLQFNYTPSMREYSASHTSPFAMQRAKTNGQRLQKFNFMNLHADFMWNLSNAIGGYKESRLYEAIPYLGLGYGKLSSGVAHSSEQITANVGLINQFRVSRTVDINLELRSAIANGSFDRSTIRNKVDVPVAVTVGATFRIGKVKTFKRATTVAPADYSLYQNRIKTLENSNSTLNDKAKQLAEEVETLKNRQPEVVTVTDTDLKTEVPPVVLFFSIGSSTLDAKGLTSLDLYISNVIKTDPNKVFTIIGSADKTTGSPKINQKLSEERTQYVYDLLVKEYGVAKDRIVKKAEGGNNNRFADPELNRNVIIE